MFTNCIINKLIRLLKKISIIFPIFYPYLIKHILTIIKDNGRPFYRIKLHLPIVTDKLININNF